MARSTYFVTCVPGTEPFLHAEVKRLGFSKAESQVAGVKFEGTRVDAWRANLALRTGIRVLERLVRYKAPDEDALYAGAKAIEWERWLSPNGTLVVEARSKESELFHTRYLQQLIKDAVCDRFREATGERPSVDPENPDLRIDLHLFRDRATLSLDTSGAPLYKRSWRKHQGRAPLAENLAAALVLASGWDGRSPLIDPFCGSGTILVEAAWIAAGRLPGVMRKEFGFERFVDHDAAGYAKVLKSAREQGRSIKKLTLVGLDVDPDRIEEARENLASAGVEARIQLDVGDARSWEPRAGWNAWIVTNPPYGERIGTDGNLLDLYSKFSSRLHQLAGGYHVTMISSLTAGLDRLPFVPTARTPILNGGIECELIVGEVGLDAKASS